MINNTSTKESLIPQERIESALLFLRGEKVILDRDLASLYGVQTRDLNKAVRRNLFRFPEDFMFQLTKEEFQNLMFQFGTSSWAGTSKPPNVFTEFADHCAGEGVFQRTTRRLNVVSAVEETSYSEHPSLPRTEVKR